MDSSDLACKFTARIERSGGRHLIEVPSTEVELGNLSTENVCRVGIEVLDSQPSEERTSGEGGPRAPVSVGERRTVEIEDIGREGDGLARVDRGYVLIVPDTSPGDEVKVEVQEVTPNVGFAEVVEE